MRGFSDEDMSFVDGVVSLSSTQKNVISQSAAHGLTDWDNCVEIGVLIGGVEYVLLAREKFNKSSYESFVARYPERKFFSWRFVEREERSTGMWIYSNIEEERHDCVVMGFWYKNIREISEEGIL